MLAAQRKEAEEGQKRLLAERKVWEEKNAALQATKARLTEQQNEIKVAAEQKYKEEVHKVGNEVKELREELMKSNSLNTELQAQHNSFAEKSFNMEQVQKTLREKIAAQEEELVVAAESIAKLENLGHHTQNTPQEHKAEIATQTSSVSYMRNHNLASAKESTSDSNDDLNSTLHEQHTSSSEVDSLKTKVNELEASLAGAAEALRTAAEETVHAEEMLQEERDVSAREYVIHGFVSIVILSFLCHGG